MADVRDAGTAEHALTEQLTAARTWHEQLTQVVPLRADHAARVAAVRAALEQARAHATDTAGRADRLDILVLTTPQLTGRLRREWDSDRPDVAAAAHTIRAGTGLLGQHRGAVRAGHPHLHTWGDQWRLIVTPLPADTAGPVVVTTGFRRPPPNVSGF